MCLCKKSYADKRRRPIEFEVGDYVYLKVSPMKKVQRFGVKRKLAPRFLGPYPIIEKSGRVVSQNRPIYKSTSTMAARKRSHCHT